MGFFGLFKKKDDFDSMLKDPLTDPFSQMPDSPLQQNPFQESQANQFSQSQTSQFQAQQQNPGYQTPDMPGMPKSEAGMDDFSSSLEPNNYNTSANPMPPMQNSGGGQAAYSQSFQPRNKGPEVYEEMALQPPSSLGRKVDLGIDKKDFEILNLKLDTIKSQLDNLTQRLANFEKKPYEEELPRPRRYNW